MQWRPRSRESYAHALLSKLPIGEIWPRAPDTTLVETMTGLAGVVARWAERVGMFLITEAFPPHSYHMLPDWERVLGLPEPCIPAAQTLEERRAAVSEKLSRRPGAQSRNYYIGIAERLGYQDITIREFQPFMFGVSRLGDPRWRIAPPEMRYTWIVTVPGERLSWFRFGYGRSGQDPHLRIRRGEDLECVLRRMKPAHTQLIFSYTGA